jgi:SpoVK/Ycf46/Vps4 family AAA+-type ATPase
MYIGNLNVADMKKVITKGNIKKWFKGGDAFHNKFYFPPPDYGTRRLIFKRMIEAKGGKLD